MLSTEDRAWFDKADKVGVRQLFLPDMRRNTILATFVAVTNLIAFSTVGLWMPLFLKEAHGWSAAEYGSFYVAWGLIGVVGIAGAGWIADLLGRRLGFVLMLAQGALFLTLWIYAEGRTELWVYGLLWSIGFLGVWGRRRPTRPRCTRPASAAPATASPGQSASSSATCSGPSSRSGSARRPAASTWPSC
ncbi:MFS transporter [Dankookia sp. P2]|uniref:MFS transporter n=1 Tax=Dankookia sp. P2 TaxID=3423955 RepID=UPI003D67C099